MIKGSWQDVLHLEQPSLGQMGRPRQLIICPILTLTGTALGPGFPSYKSKVKNGDRGIRKIKSKQRNYKLTGKKTHSFEEDSEIRGYVVFSYQYFNIKQDTCPGCLIEWIKLCLERGQGGSKLQLSTPVRPIEVTWPFFMLKKPWVNRKLTKEQSVHRKWGKK